MGRKPNGGVLSGFLDKFKKSKANKAFMALPQSEKDKILEVYGKVWNYKPYTQVIEDWYEENKK